MSNGIRMLEAVALNSLLVFVVVACSSGMDSNLYGAEYRGFQVDYSEVRENPNFGTLRSAMNKQIDMVLDVGVPIRMLNFFQHVPITVRAGKESFAGHYTGKTKAVELTSGFLSTGHKPALLHELLHAYHHQVMPGGFNNPQVLAYFNKAKELHVYDLNSHMMANAKEYFASTGTAYLYGVTELEPFTREKVQKSQPYFSKYLESLFGPQAGKYNGIIEH